MAQNTDNVKRLHESLSSKVKGFTVPYEQFAEDMKDEAKLKTLHGNLSKMDGFTVPYEQFKIDMLGESVSKVPYTDEDVEAVRAEAKGVVYKPDSNIEGRMPIVPKEELSYQKDMTLPYVDPQPVKDYMSMFSKKTPTPVTAEKTGVSEEVAAETGEAFLDVQPKSEKRFYNYKQAKIYGGFKETFPEYSGDVDEIAKLAASGNPDKEMQASSRFEQLRQSVIGDERYGKYAETYVFSEVDDSIERLISDTKKITDIYTKSDKNNVLQNFGMGVGVGVEQYVKGYTELLNRMNDNVVVQRLKDKIRRLSSDENINFSEEEKILIQVLDENSAAHRRIQRILPSFYNIGKGLGGSIGFMLEFILAGGVAKTVLAPVEGLVTAGRIGGAVSPLTRGGMLLAEAGVRNAAMPSMYQKMAERVSLGESGASAFVNAYTDNFGEVISEMAFMGQGKVGKGAVNEILRKAGLAYSTDKGVISMVDGIGKEYLEEKLAEIYNAPRDYNTFARFYSDFISIKRNLETLGVVSILGGALTAPSIIGDHVSRVRSDVVRSGLQKRLPSEITGAIDQIFQDNDIGVSDAFALSAEVIHDALKNGTIEGDYNQVVGDALRYANEVAKAKVRGYVEKAKPEEILPEDAAVIPTVEPVEITPEVSAEVSEQQKQIDYLKSRGQVIPDGTDMETLSKMFSAEKTKERTAINTEIDTKVKAAQERFGLPQTPDIEISEDTEATLDRIDEGLPVTNEFIMTASDELYGRYRELEAMKTADTRLYTTEQIESMQGYLGEEIERLESYAIEQKETGKFVSEVESGKVAEGEAEGVAEGVSEVVGASETGVETVSKEGGQIVPAEEKVAVKASEEVLKSVEDIELKRKEELNPDKLDIDNVGGRTVVSGYHGGAVIKKFEVRPSEQNTIGDGIYFFPTDKNARGYAEMTDGVVNKARIELNNPFVIDFRKRFFADPNSIENKFYENQTPKEKTEWLRANGYDGVVNIPFSGDVNDVEIVALDAAQVQTEAEINAKYNAALNKLTEEQESKKNESSLDGRSEKNVTPQDIKAKRKYIEKIRSEELEKSTSGLSRLHVMAADYLLTGGVGSILSSDYLIQGIGGVFTRASYEIDAIRNKYSDAVNKTELADVKNFVGTETYNKIVSEIRDAIKSVYDNNAEINSLFDEVIKNPTGLPVKDGNRVSKRIDEIHSQIESDINDKYDAELEKLKEVAVKPSEEVVGETVQPSIDDTRKALKDIESVRPNIVNDVNVIPDDIILIRNKSYGLRGVKKKLPFIGKSVFAVKRSEYDKLKKYALDNEGVPVENWEVVDRRDVDAVALKMSETNDWVNDFSDKKPVPELFDPSRHIVQFKEDGSVDYTPGVAYELLINDLSVESIAKAYHQAKEKGYNTQLVNQVDEILGRKKDAVQVEKAVSVPVQPAPGVGKEVEGRAPEAKPEEVAGEKKEVSWKQQQFDVIQRSNPMTDEVHTGIRNVEDIKTADEVFAEPIKNNENPTPDFTVADMKAALESGEVTIYSSNEIADGVFVTPSKMQAKSYSGDGKVYSKKVALADVAWIDMFEGQYAKVKEVKKESDDKKRKRRLQRTDRQPAANGQPIVGKGETSAQGVRLVDGTIVKAGDEVVYKGETRKVKSVKGDVVTIPGVGDIHKSKVLAPTKPVQDTRGFNLEETNPNKVNDDLLSDEVFDRMRMNNIEPSDTDVLGTAALAKSLMNGDVTVEAAINEAVDRFAKRGTVPDHVPFFKAAPGAKHTSPYATYNDAVRGQDNAGKNLWVRNTPFSTNKNRVLLVQFSSNFLYGKQPFKRDKNSSYFDKLYRLVAGYNRTVDFWEVPLWMARIAGLQRNADVYVVRDIEEAKRFINEAGYESVHFSALDVNEKHIVDVIQGTPGTKYQIGGYTDFKRIEAFPNVTVYKSIDEYVKNNKLEDAYGTYSYRHFKGTAVIPRLKLSEGCLYKCAFCSIPKKVIPVKKEWVDSQIESIKDLDATLVYLDDKTFGQAENYTLLPELYERIKEYNPDFKGFIVQTTALDFANKKRFSPEYLKNSHIQFVELGVETYNDDILTKLNKKHSHKKFVDAAMQNVRDNNIKVIPNIIVGLSWNEGTKEKPVIKTETKQTYQNTLDFLEDNKDIISHVNVYSLALYEGTELNDAIEVKEEADKNENIIAKSWQENKEDHEWAMDEFSDFASNQIQKKDEIQKEEKGLRNEKVNARFKKIAKQTGTDVETVTKMYDTLMSVFGLSRDKALAGAVIVDRMVGTMAKRTNKTKAQVYATIKWEKGVMEEIMKMSPLLQSTLWHGSPYQFDKFTTEKIGTGEGAQAFGWGLYFTELEGIARYYAKKLGKRSIIIDDSIKDNPLAYELVDDHWGEYKEMNYSFRNFVDAFLRMGKENIERAEKNLSKVDEYVEDERQRIEEIKNELAANETVLSMIDSFGMEKSEKERVRGRLQEHINNLKSFVNFNAEQYRANLVKLYTKSLQDGRDLYEKAKFIDDNFDKYRKQRIVYKVTVHKGKTPDEYEWLEWDKEITDAQISKIEKIDKSVGDVLRNWSKNPSLAPASSRSSNITGDNVYRYLTSYFNSDKEASLFLLRAGIDGNKYPAESLSGKDARGFNFVVFDENAITIEEAIKFQQKVLGRARGAQVWQDAYAVIYALTDPNVTTPLHELAHVYEKYLTAKEKEQILKWTVEERGLKWTGAESWSVNTSESFARGFERFLYDGTAPGNLKAIFQKFAAWLKDIYKSLVASEINVTLNDDMRRIYSTMLGSEYEEMKVPTEPSQTAEEAADAYFGSAPVDADGNIILSDEDIADQYFSGLEVDENGVVKLQLIGTVGAARLDAAENNNNRIFNLREAMKMTDANKTAEEIKLATGWEKGKDKRWRYEIPDNMKMRTAWDKLKVSDYDNKYELPITEAIDYPELFAAYPELEKIKIRKDTAFLDIFQSVQGWYNPESMELVVSPNAIDPFGTILHELQHAVQQIEGFATGTNTEEIMAAIPDFEFESVVDQLVEQLERDIKKNMEKNLTRSKILSGLTAKEEADIRRYSKEIIAAKEEGDRLYEEEKKKFPDRNPYKENKRILELTTIKTDLRNKINDIIERVLGERSITLAVEFSYGIEAVEEYIDVISEKIIEDNKAKRSIERGADKAYIIKNFSPVLGDMAYNYYKRVAGETEARNVAARAKLTPEQRRSTAESTEDIPRDRQIVMRGGKIVSMDLGSTTVVVDGKKRPVLNSEGRPIHNTEEGIINFWKWFGNSVTVDNQGRPRIFYHGTKSDFDEFKGDIKYKDAMVYFSDNPEFAQEWIAREIDSYYSNRTKEEIEAVKEEERAERSLLNNTIDWKRLNKKFESPAEWTPEDEEYEVQYEARRKLMWGRRLNAYSSVIPSFLNVKKLFDPRIDEHFNLVKSLLEKRFQQSADELTRRGGKRSNYLFYEDYDIVQLLKEHGFDAMFISEKSDGEPHTYAIFSPNQIKSATGNVGTFSPETGNILFQEPKSKRDIAVDMLYGLIKNETSKEAARARIDAYLTSRGIKFGVDGGNIVADAIARLGLSDDVVEAPVRPTKSAPSKGGTTEGGSERLGEGKTKKSKLGLRLISGKSNIPDNVKALIEKNRLHEYRVLSHEEGQRIAKELYDTNGLVESYNAFFSTKMHSALEVYFGANIIMGMKAEIEQAEKDGRNGDADYWSDQLLKFSDEYIHRVSVERAQGLNALGSAFIQSLFPSRAYVRKYINSVNNARAEVLNSKPFKKKLNRAKDEFKEVRSGVVKTVLEELEEKVIKIKGGASLRDLMKEKKRLLDELKATKDRGIKMSIPIPNIPGLSQTEVAYGTSIASLYIQGGIYGDKLVERLIKDFDTVGITVTEEQAYQMIPTRMTVGGVEMDTEDVIEENETNKAALRLANRIFGSVIEKKEKDNPMSAMLNTLMAKFNERNIHKPEKKKLPVIDKIAEAIKNREMYADVWAEAKDKALNIVENKEDLSDEEKTSAKQLINDSYDKATTFTFTEKQIDEAIRNKAKDLGIMIRDIVTAHYDIRARHMGTITNALIIDADLTAEEATVLAEAINRRYNTLMAERGKKLLERYTKHLTETQKRSATRKKEEDRLLELINIGAFDDPSFTAAFANARGMKQIDPEQIEEIKRRAEEVQKQKSAKIRARKLEDLLGYMAHVEGATIMDKLEGLWFAQVLGTLPTQIRNVIGAFTGVTSDAVAMLTTNPTDAIPSTINSLRRAGRWGKQSAGDVIRNGYTSYIQKIETPRVTEYLHMNPERVRRALRFIPFYWNHLKYTSRLLGANDVFHMTTAKEVWVDVLTRRGVMIDGKKYSRYKYIFDSKYRAEVDKIVDKELFISKEQMDGIRAEIDADAITYGYTSSDKKIAIMEAIDMLRPAKIVEDATWLASTATGNVPTYGTLGFLTDRLAEILKNIGLRRPQKTESGDYIWVQWKPFYYAAAFTKITSNVVSRMMEFAPGLGALRYFSGSVGFFYKDEFFLGANSNKFARYYRELSREEKNMVGRRQLVGTAFALAMYLLSDPGDDDDPIIRITANGTGNYAKNKENLEHADWKEYSVGIKTKEGRVWLPYRLTPLALILAPIGWMRDKKRHNLKYKDVPDAVLFLKALQWMPWFIGDVTAIMSMNEVLNGLFSEKSMKDVNVFVDDGSGETVEGKAMDFAWDFSNNIVKSFAPTLKGFYTPILYRDVLRMWEWWTERELDVEPNQFKRLINLNPISFAFDKERGMVYMDVFGRETTRPLFLSEFFDYKTSDDIAAYHVRNANAFPATQWGSKMFEIKTSKGVVSRTLDPNDRKDEELMWYYNKRRAEYLLRGVDSNEGYIMGVEALKAYGITGEKYQEAVDRLDYVAQQQAREDVLEVSAFDLPYLRQHIGR